MKLKKMEEERARKQYLGQQSSRVLEENCAMKNTKCDWL